MRLLITGSSGYIGERLVRFALSRGHEVIAASRQAPSTPMQWIPFDFSSASEIKLPENIDAILHLAATTRSGNISDGELKAAKHLSQMAEQSCAKMIFVSSQTACEDAPTEYGKTKWQIERIILHAGGWVVRPGQVYGGQPRALFGVLVTMVKILPVVPVFLPSLKIQPVHVDDLVTALLNCAELNTITPSILCVGAPEPISFTEFLYAIALKRLRRRWRLPIPVPVIFIQLTGIIIGSHLRKKFGFERLNSLLHLPVMDTRQDLQRLGISLRLLLPGMARSGDGRRYDLLREGQALLTYILKTKPEHALVRRYVRSIESLKNAQPLYLPEFMLNAPITIAILDDSTEKFKNFMWRLNVAIAFAEASVQGSRSFLAMGEASGLLINLVHITTALVLELWWRILRLFFLPILTPMLRNSGL